VISGREREASTAIAVVVALGLQAPFWVVAALVVGAPARLGRPSARRRGCSSDAEPGHRQDVPYSCGTTTDDDAR
jgi:hypothetical protein